MTPEELQAFLHERIPITVALGLSVRRADRDCVRLHAPLAPNRNHQMTAFAGSLASVAILAGWAWLLLALREQHPSARIVVRRSSVDFLAPVACDIEAVCAGPEEGLWAPFEKAVRLRGRGRITLAASVLVDSSEVAMRSVGDYAAVITNG